MLIASVALLCGCNPGPDENLEHGTVRITLTPAQNVEGNPFVGTAQIRAVMDYDTCLQNFYESNPEYQQDGAIGETVFGTYDDGGEGWAERLCDDTPPQQVPCESVTIEQQLDNAKELRVIYNVSTTDLETKYVLFGPIPLAGLAMCEAGVQPRVSLSGNAVAGLDAQGGELWQTVTFDTPQAVPNQGADLVVSIGPSN